MTDVIQQLSPQELKAWMDKNNPFYFLDVRPESAFLTCHVQGAQNIPFDSLASEYYKLPEDTPIVVMCNRGISSQKACEILREAGYTKLYNLAGGIHAWSEQIDPSIPLY